MKTSEPALLDTNILVYASDQDSPHFEKARGILDRGLSGELSLYITPQILCEYTAIVTDPRRVTHPRSRKDVLDELNKFRKSKNLLIIYPLPGTIEWMMNLFNKYSVTKQEFFDLFLVATMLTYQITRLYTFNTSDFRIYSEISIISI